MSLAKSFSSFIIGSLAAAAPCAAAAPLAMATLNIGKAIKPNLEAWSSRTMVLHEVLHFMFDAANARF